MRLFRNKTGIVGLCKHDIGSPLCKHFCRGKAVNIISSGCVLVALGINRAMRMRHIMLSSVECPDVRYFSTSNHQRYGFREIFAEHTKCYDFSLQLLSETFLILR